MIIREKLARARALLRDLPVYASVHDLMLHESSPANPAYMAKKEACSVPTRSRVSNSATMPRYASRSPSITGTHTTPSAPAITRLPAPSCK